ncbi:BPSS1780 family membrane protein [Propionivibrio sp.]|uniref:BPSS1780 family membrane protein n=1 Tax=Propionivibrio sp. TaxID=2212460 RepID=UPI002634F7BD|nr:BPSS1780 family membrane protein [Propionivibrio sp.]
MQALTLPSRRGWHWLYDGFGIFRRNQLVLSLAVLGYWMLMALISSFPLIGQVAAPLLIPVFTVSLMNACRLLAQGGPLPPHLLFSGFQKNLRALLVLGAVYIVVGVVVLGIVASVDDGVLFRLVVLGQRPGKQVLTSDSVMFGGQLALLLFLPLMMAYWYAPMLVAWHDLSAGKSLFFSFVACLRNWRAFLVYSVATLVVGALIPGVLVGLFSALFAGVGELFSVVLTAVTVFTLVPTLYASFYVSYRDVFVTIDENV